MRLIISVQRYAVKPHRRTERKPAPFGLGVDPVLDDWTDGPFRFVLSEPADLTRGRYRLVVYVDGLPVSEHWYDGAYGPQHARADAVAMAEEHRQIKREQEIERFEAWMAEQDRLADLSPAPICGGCPADDRSEPSEADRRWWAETRDRETRTYGPRRGRGVAGITDEDVVVATGCVG